MWRLTIGIILVLLITPGCQSKFIEEVVNDFPEIHNLEALDKFSKDVQNGAESEVKYLSFGIEGQRRVRHLSYDGNKIIVSHSVNGDLVEEYNCENIIVENDNGIDNYILSKCNVGVEDIRDIWLVAVNGDGKIHLE